MSDGTECLRQQHDNGTCPCRPATVTVGQTLDEMDFERGIWSAAIYNEVDRIKDFIWKGEKDRRDISGYTALHYASRQGHEEVCRLLIQSGADVNTQTNGGATSLHRAAMMGHRNIVKLLIRSAAKLDLQDDDGQTALHRSAAKGFVEVSTDLLNALNSLKSIQDSKGRVPFDLIPNGNAELKELLLPEFCS